MSELLKYMLRPDETLFYLDDPVPTVLGEPSMPLCFRGMVLQKIIFRVHYLEQAAGVLLLFPALSFTVITLSLVAPTGFILGLKFKRLFHTTVLISVDGTLPNRSATHSQQNSGLVMRQSLIRRKCFHLYTRRQIGSIN